MHTILIKFYKIWDTELVLTLKKSSIFNGFLIVIILTSYDKKEKKGDEYMKINTTKVKEVIQATNPQTAMLYCFIVDANGCTSALQLSKVMGQSKRNICLMLSELINCGYLYRLEKGFRVL